MFPILKHLAAIKSDFERTMEGCDPTIRGQYSTILNIFHSTVSILNHYHRRPLSNSTIKQFIFTQLGCENTGGNSRECQN